MTDQKFRFWTNYLKLVSLVLALMGMLWAVTGMFDPFGVYDRLMAETFYNQETIPRDAEIIFRFILGPLGATCAGYFTMQFFLAKYAFSKRKMWGYQAVTISFLIWFIIDTMICLIHGAYFNIYLANIPAFLAMIPIFSTYGYFKTKPFL